MKSSFKTALIAAVVSAFVAAGAAVATTQAFTLGTTNRVNAPSKVSNVQSNGTTVNPVDAPLLTLENKTTTASSTPLSLLAAPNHPPLNVNTGIKVTNLNADRLDGFDSSDFLLTSAVQRIGPITVNASSSGNTETLVAFGQLEFLRQCYDNGSDEQLGLFLRSSDAHAAYASVSYAQDAQDRFSVDMVAGNTYVLGFGALTGLAPGTPAFAAVTGQALRADGHEVFFSIYAGQNVRGVTDGRCFFGGTFVVK